MKLRKKTNWRPKLETLETRRLLSVYGDFNGDGFDDVAIGIPGEDSGAGMVQILYGSAAGPTATGSQSWTQSSLGTDATEAGDNFGAALAGGDFNNDGFTDLAIGVPGEDVGTTVDAGAIHLILGSASGLTGAGDKVFHQNSNRVRDISEEGDNFGAALAAGDFNGDGFMDLGVGIPNEDVGPFADAGMVQVLYGAVSGLIPGFNPPWTLNDPNIPDSLQAIDYFGEALAAGDFNNDGRDDLAIGIRNHATSENGDGAVCILYGTAATGLSAIGSQLWHQDSPGVPDTNEDKDHFGTALAAGDFNNDGRYDLAIASPTEDVGAIGLAGAVTVLYGSATGIGTTGAQFWTQGDMGGPNVTENSDRWGTALAVGDTNADGDDDLYVSAGGEDLGAVANAGVVNQLVGTPSGLFATAAELTQEVNCSGNASENDDSFGQALSLGDYDGDGDFDLATGAPLEDVGAITDAGTVCVSPSLTGFAKQTWTQDSTGIFDTAEAADGFGGGLDAGSGRSSNDGNSGRPDLAQLISADLESDSRTKLNKRRNLSGRR
jgi:hypothetical protein